MTWSELFSKLLISGVTRDQIADTIRGSVKAGLLSSEEATARIDQLDRMVPDIKPAPMLMVLHTQSGSIYEVDRKNKRVRRLNGKKDPTTRMGKDGEWRSYLDLQPDPPEVGLPLLIVWDPATTPLLPDTVAEAAVPTTVTSVVASIDPPLS